MFKNCKTKEELISRVKSVEGITQKDFDGGLNQVSVFYPQEYLLLLVDLILVYGYKLGYAPAEDGFQEAIQRLDPFSCRNNKEKIYTYRETSTCDGMIDFILKDNKHISGDDYVIDAYIGRRIRVYPLLQVTDDGEPVYGDMMTGVPYELERVIQEVLMGFGYKEVNSNDVTIFGEYISMSNLEGSIDLANEVECHDTPTSDSQFGFMNRFILKCDTGYSGVPLSEKEKEQSRKNHERAIQRLESSLAQCKAKGFPGIFITSIGSIPMLPEFM